MDKIFGLRIGQSYLEINLSPDIAMRSRIKFTGLYSVESK